MSMQACGYNSFSLLHTLMVKWTLPERGIILRCHVNRVGNSGADTPGSKSKSSRNEEFQLKGGKCNETSHLRGWHLKD